MSRRALLAFFLLPLWLLIERAAYYGMRVGASLYMVNQLGLSREEVSENLSRSIVMVVLSPIIGGLLAIATGPRVTLLLGSVVLIAAYAALGSGWDNIALIFAILALGRGLSAPSVWAIAGSDLEGASENQRNALFLACYLAVNFAAAAGAASFGLVASALPSAFYLLAAAILVPAVVAAVLLGSDLSSPRVPPKRPGSAAAGILLMTLLAIPGFWAMGASDEAQYRIVAEQIGWQLAGMLNPAVVICLCALGLALLIMPNAPLQVRTMHLMGAGSILLAISALPLAAGMERSSAIMAAMALAAFGEVLMGVGIVRCASGVHPRAATGLVAVWMLATTGSSQVATWLGWSGAPAPLLAGAGAFLALVCGGLLIALAKIFDEKFF